MKKRPNSETLAAHIYEIIERRPSRFVPNTEVTYTIGTRCPRCETVLPPMEHGDSQKCSKCALKMELFGNALTIWE
jgi:ribosomal protein S27AE